MKMNKHNISFLACGGLAHSNRITRWGRSGQCDFTPCRGKLMPEEALIHLPYLTHITSLRVRHSY